jgi:hypothetical protein
MVSITLLDWNDPTSVVEGFRELLSAIYESADLAVFYNEASHVWDTRAHPFETIFGKFTVNTLTLFCRAVPDHARKGRDLCKQYHRSTTWNDSSLDI